MRNFGLLDQDLHFLGESADCGNERLDLWFRECEFDLIPNAAFNKLLGQGLFLISISPMDSDKGFLAYLGLRYFVLTVVTKPSQCRQLFFDG